MPAESGTSVNGRSGAAIAAEVSALPDFELKMILVEWKRWRAHVQTAPVMRMRRERFDEADAYINAIEQELTLREPGERLLRRRRALSTLREVADAATVSFASYRTARNDLARLERRRPK
jgi:hypothetical protein